jgi:hypothetical protein
VRDIPAGVRWLLLLLAACCSLPVLADAAGADAAASGDAPAALGLPLHEAIYQASIRRIPVRAGLRLERQNERLLVYRTWVEPRGVLSFVRRELTESSLVMLDSAGGVVPISYRRHDGLGGRDSDMRFDLSAGQLHITYRDEQTTIDWEPGIYDLLSLRLALASDFARGRLRDVYRVVDDRARVEEVDVEVAGEEVLATPLGDLKTVRLEYRSERRDRLYRLWIAPGLDAAMVRLEQHEEGRLRGRLDLVEYRRL